MSNVLLILDDSFVGLTDAEAVVIAKKTELNNRHVGSTIDQFLLSNIVLNKVELASNNYDFIYYIDNSKEFNLTIPNNANIKQSLRLTTSLSLKPRKTNKLSGLRKFKKLASSSPSSSSSSSPSLSVSGVGFENPISLAPSPLVDAEKKLRYLDDLLSTSSSDSDSEEDELIDENALISESSLLNESSIICLNEPTSTGIKRRKACKDCTCGLAEREAFMESQEQENMPLKLKKQLPKVQFSVEELSEIDFTIEGKTGGCGSCSLGDAFRCAGCPFLGLPAFKPGQAINLTGITDDL